MKAWSLKHWTTREAPVVLNIHCGDNRNNNNENVWQFVILTVKNRIALNDTVRCFLITILQIRKKFGASKGPASLRSSLCVAAGTSLIKHRLGYISLLLKAPGFPSLLEDKEGKKVNSLSCVRFFATPWTVAYQAPLSMGFSRQEYWSGMPFPSPGGLPDPGIEPRSPELEADTLTSEPPGKPDPYIPWLQTFPHPPE